MEKILTWMFGTKAGKFVFIIVFDIIVLGIIASVSTLGFWSMMTGGIAAAVILSVIDSNKRWY